MSEQPPRSPDRDLRREIVAVAVFYASTLAGLLGLYWAATRLAEFEPAAALLGVGLCGALVLGVAVPATLKSWSGGSAPRADDTPRTRMLGIAVGASLAGVAALLAMQEKFLTAAALALAAILVLRFGFRR